MYVRKTGLETYDKTVMKTTLREVNTKIKTEEESSRIKPLLTFRYPLTGKV